MTRAVTTRRAAERAGRRGYFAVAVYHPKTSANVGSLWRSAGLYGAAFLATVGRRYVRQPSDTEHAAQHSPLIHFDTVDDLFAHLPDGCALVGVEQTDRSQSLDSWVHPHRALYLFGAEDHGLPPAVLDLCHHVIEIPSPTPRSMNVASAGAVMIYDRHRSRERMITIEGTAR